MALPSALDHNALCVALTVLAYVYAMSLPGLFCKEDIVSAGVNTGTDNKGEQGLERWLSG